MISAHSRARGGAWECRWAAAFLIESNIKLCFSFQNLLFKEKKKK
jgi:hypothetical protein